MVELNQQSRTVITVHIACIVVTTIAITLRFAARFSMRQRIDWDDWFILLSWTTLQVYLGMIIKMTYMGSTMMLTVLLPPQDMLVIFKMSYAGGIIFEIVNVTVKASILCFYCRIFTIENFKRQAYIVGGVCTAWFISSVLVTAFQCTPARKAWYRTIPGSCINLDAFVLGYEISNGLLDITLIILPLRMIQSLKLNKREKLQLSSIFVLGGFVIIASILRMVYLYHPSDPGHIYVNGPIWSAISISAAVLCANLPMLKPITRVVVVVSSIRSWCASVRSTTHETEATEGSKQRKYNVIRDDTPVTIGGTAERQSAKRGQQDLYPLDTFNTTVGGTVVDHTVDEHIGSRTMHSRYQSG